MFETLRLIADSWLILMAIAACVFIFSDFDRRRREEWFALAMMLPALVWAFWLALADILARAGGLMAGL